MENTNKMKLEDLDILSESLPKNLIKKIETSWHLNPICFKYEKVGHL